MTPVTRARLNRTAIALALLGVVAGVGSAVVPLEPPPAAENYASQRALRESVGTALMLAGVVVPLVSVVLGIIARALAGTLVGALATALMIFVVPGLMRACCGGTDGRVIGVLRTINTAQQAYSIGCAGDKGFAETLDRLTKPPAPGASPYLSAETARGRWLGYAVTMQIPDGAILDVTACDGTRVASRYFVEAHLIDDPRGGSKHFATDERGTIYWKDGGRPIEPGMAGAQPLQ